MSVPINSSPHVIFRKKKNKDTVYFVLSTRTQEEYKGDKCKDAAEKAALIAGNTYDPCAVRVLII